MNPTRLAILLLAICFLPVLLPAQNNALLFNGTEEYIELPDFSETSSGSIEMWILPDDIESENFIFGNGNTSTLSLILSVTNDNKIHFSCHDGNSHDVYSEINTVAYTSWTHIAITWNTSKAKLYVNGVVDSIAFGTLTSATGYWLIGASTITGSMNYFKGKIDEFRLWDDVRTETEIIENMCRIIDPSNTNLVAYYRMDEIINVNQIEDITLNTNDGTIINMDNANLEGSEAFTTWTGSTSSDWAVASNWTDGVPDLDDNAGIPSTGYSPSVNSAIATNLLVVGSGATLDFNFSGSHVIHGNVYNIGTTNINDDFLTITGSLYMLSGSTLNINPGGALTIEKTLYNRTGLFGHATLNINSTASGTGSLIIEGSVTNNGNIYCKRYIDDWNTGDGWHFLSSPVENQRISTEFVDINDTISSSVDFYKWSEPLDLWINIKNEDGTYNKGSEPTNFSNDPDPTFGVGLGYLVAYQSDVTKTFSGDLNNYSPTKTELSYTSSSSYTGAHLLGNPFPSALQWNQTVGDPGDPAGPGWHLDHINGTAKIWSSSNSGYIDIGQNGIIPAMQGFMVIVSDPGPGSLTIYKGDRTHSETNWYKETIANKLMVIAHDPAGGKAQESVLMAKDDATDGFDTPYDSPFFSGYAPLFYSWINQKPASTNAISSFDENLMIPFAFQKNASTDFYITIEGTENLIPSREVYLIDHKLNQTHPLSQNPTYYFSSQEGDDPNRFAITFKAVGIDEPEITTTNQLPIHCWNHEQTLTISNPEQLQGTIHVVSMTGQILLSTTLKNELIQPIHHNLCQGIYIVHIFADKQTKTQKLVIP